MDKTHVFGFAPYYTIAVRRQMQVPRESLCKPYLLTQSLGCLSLKGFCAACILFMVYVKTTSVWTCQREMQECWLLEEVGVGDIKYSKICVF